MRLLIRYRRVYVVLLHLAFIVVANYGAFWLRFDGAIPPWALTRLLQMLPWLVLIRGVVFAPFRLYEGTWRYTSIWDLRNIIGGVLSSTLVFLVVTRWGFGFEDYPRAVFVVDSGLLILLLGGVRLSRRIYRELGHLELDKSVLIYGAGDAGEMIVRDMKGNSFYEYEPIGFVDDDPAKVGQRIHGLKVLGTRNDLARILAREQPSAVLVAMPRAEPATIREVVSQLAPFKVPIMTLPNLRDVMNGHVTVSQMRSLAIEDLLERAPVGLQIAPVRRFIEGKRVMVTGAGGSIGAELCRQVAALRPAGLILFERYENGLYAIGNELASRHDSLFVQSAIGDVTDASRVDAVLREHHPQVIFHAAAHKHVPLMELNPCEAVKNNVAGTRVMATAAAEQGVERFILISSDKAVNPSSVMGATKRIAELVMLRMNGRARPCFVAVRFGNVLGSNGSVVPLFLQQIRAGGPVTVTHPEIRRYFMLTQEAVQLVLHAGAIGSPGSVYVLEMGDQIKVLDLARNLIRLSGFLPDEDIAIKFIGLRPGEKLFEELVGKDETLEPSPVEKVFRVCGGASPDHGEFDRHVAELERLAGQGDGQGVIRALGEIVPAYGLADGEGEARP
jgi:FlaA1/EpsC-like NDP-sugar epimerase